MCVDAIMPLETRGGNQSPPGAGGAVVGANVGAKMRTCVLYNSSACSQPLCNLSSHVCCSLNRDSTSLYFTHLDTPECVWTVENEGKYISGHSNEIVGCRLNFI